MGPKFSSLSSLSKGQTCISNEQQPTDKWLFWDWSSLYALDWNCSVVFSTQIMKLSLTTNSLLRTSMSPVGAGTVRRSVGKCTWTELPGLFYPSRNCADLQPFLWDALQWLWGGEGLKQPQSWSWAARGDPAGPRQEKGQSCIWAGSSVQGPGQPGEVVTHGDMVITVPHTVLINHLIHNNTHWAETNLAWNTLK